MFVPPNMTHTTKQEKYLGSNKHICMKFQLQDHYVPLECAGQCRLSANLCKCVLDVTAGVIVEATRNADMLTINASEDFQSNAQNNMNDYKTHSEENQSDHMS